VYGVRSIDPSRLPGDPARLGVPGYRMGLSISRRGDPAARNVTKVATYYVHGRTRAARWHAGPGRPDCNHPTEKLQ